MTQLADLASPTAAVPGAPEARPAWRRPSTGGFSMEGATWWPRMPPVSPGRNDWTIWVPDSRAVTDVEEHNLYLHRILRAAYKNIPAYVTHPCITVGVVDDATAGGPCLALVVAIADDEDEAARRIERFDREWLHDALARARGQMCVVVVPATEDLLPFDDAARAIVRQARAEGHTLVLTAPASCARPAVAGSSWLRVHSLPADSWGRLW